MGTIFEVEIDSKFLIKDYFINKLNLKNIAKYNNVNILEEEHLDNIPVWCLFKWQLLEYKFVNINRFNFFIDCFECLSKENIILNNSEIEKYIDFFKYLLEIHYEFKVEQQYKLMWNLENLYIKKLVTILINNGKQISYLNNITKHREQSYLYTIYKSDEFDFFEKHFNYFINENSNFAKFLKNEFNLDKSSISKLLFINEDYYITLQTIIELNNRWKQQKYNQFILISLIRGIILNVESLIKESIFCIKDNNVFITKNIENNRENIKKEKGKKDFDSKFENGSLKFLDYIRFLSNEEYFKTFDKNFRKYEDEFFFDILDISKLYLFTIEKNLFIFYKVRNYIAHNHLCFEKFFEDKSIRLNEVIESVIFILIYLEYLKQK